MRTRTSGLGTRRCARPRRRVRKKYAEPTCVRCGCTTFTPCPGGCSWARLNATTKAGVCSACLTPEELKAAQAQFQRQLEEAALKRRRRKP